MTDPRQRRGLLGSRDNPRRTIDMLLEHHIRIGPRDLTIRYVPDQLVLDMYGSRLYFDSMRDVVAADVALAVFEDVNSEIVPRWIAVCLHSGDGTIILQEARPNWSNPALLACVKAW